MRKLPRKCGVRTAACCTSLRHCSAVSSPLVVRELAVKFLKQHKGSKTLKLDRAVVTALDDDQYKVEELRAAVWAVTPKNSLKVIHGVGHRRARVVDGVPSTHHMCHRWDGEGGDTFRGGRLSWWHSLRSVAGHAARCE